MTSKQLHNARQQARKERKANARRLAAAMTATEAAEDAMRQARLRMRGFISQAADGGKYYEGNWQAALAGDCKEAINHCGDPCFMEKALNKAATAAAIFAKDYGDLWHENNINARRAFVAAGDFARAMRIAAAIADRLRDVIRARNGERYADDQCYGGDPLAMPPQD